MREARSLSQPVEIGQILGSHGLRGALRIHSETRPIEAIGGYGQWWLGATSDRATPHRVERCWLHGRKLLAQLRGVENRNDADSLANLRIFIPLDAIADEEGSYPWHRLVGCRVTTTSGIEVGTVCRLEEYGSADILVVDDHSKGGEWMIPFTESIISEVALEAQSITVDLPDGMDACFSPRS